VAVLGCGLLAAGCIGLIAGRWPAVAAVAAVAVALAVVMLMADLVVAIAIFTLATFAAVLSLGGAATGSKALGGLLVLAWLATMARQTDRHTHDFLRDHRGLVACGVGLVAWSVLSTAWAQSSSSALLGASRYAQDLVLFPIVYTGIRRFRDVRRVAAAFVGGAVAAALYGVATGSTVDGSRLVGALADPNETATVLVAASVLAIALGMGRAGSRLRQGIAFAAAVLAVFGVAATASRGAIVALAATALVAPAMAGRWRRKVGVAALVAAVLVAGWFVVLAPSSARKHVASTQTPRTTLWTLATRVIAANPVSGVGNDNFAIAAKTYLLRPGATTRADQVVTTPKVAHNIYLEVWADTGIIGLLLFAGVVLTPLRSAWRAVVILRNAGRRADEMLARALIVAIVGILAAGLFISDEYSKQLFLLLALATAMPAAARTEVGRS
jgi:O-antigen ligase